MIPCEQCLVFVKCKQRLKLYELREHYGVVNLSITIECRELMLFFIKNIDLFKRRVNKTRLLYGLGHIEGIVGIERIKRKLKQLEDK